MYIYIYIYIYIYTYSIYTIYVYIYLYMYMYFIYIYIYMYTHTVYIQYMCICICICICMLCIYIYIYICTYNPRDLVNILFLCGVNRDLVFEKELGLDPRPAFRGLFHQRDASWLLRLDLVSRPPGPFLGVRGSRNSGQARGEPLV